MIAAMLSFILGKIFAPREKKWFEDLPEGCTYDPMAGIVTVTHRGVKGYFNKSLVMEMKQSNIDYIEDFKKAVDEVFDVEDEDE
jgi:hypothetical protein